MASFSNQKVGILTAGGLAPCLSSSLGFLIEKYTAVDKNIPIQCYFSGFKGLLTGDSVVISDVTRSNAGKLAQTGGSAIQNSRVKLTNIKDCVKRGFCKEGEDPLHVAAEQLKKDGITILHTIGGDDTNTQAAALAAFLASNGYKMIVVGLPKTVDNDVFPIKQSLGAWTAAEQGAIFFRNVVNEHSANPRMLIIHECMGRDCGYLTAKTAADYRAMVKEDGELIPELKWTSAHKDCHAVYIPEVAIDLEKESARLTAVMDELDCVNIFLSEGAGVEAIVAELEAAGEEVPRDAFGHIKLDKVEPGKWFAKQFAEKIGAEKVLVQKSGYFARAAKPNAADLALIKACSELAVESGLKGMPGVIGEDEDAPGCPLRAIEFPRIKGGKEFDITTPWYKSMVAEMGQTC